MELARPD